MSIPKSYGNLFLFIRQVYRFFTPKYEVVMDNFPSNQLPTVFVSRHLNLKGPIRVLAWSRFFIRTWVLSSFVDQQDAYDHYVGFTFTERFGLPGWLARILARPLSYLASSISGSMRAIPVYRKSHKLIETFRETVASLHENIPILIFPDVDYRDDQGDMDDIYEGFLAIAQLYHRKYKQSVQFVPVYADPDRHQIHFAPPVEFDWDLPFKEQRSLKAKAIQGALNDLSQYRDVSLDES